MHPTAAEYLLRYDNAQFKPLPRPSLAKESKTKRECKTKQNAQI